jgi:hypothetical protein
MEEPGQYPIQQAQPQRTRLLTIICILTFIGSGMNFISSLFVFVFFDSFKILAAELAKSFNLPGMDMFIEGPSLFFAFSALVYAGAITGAFLMWKLKKVGFHVYIISQILLVLAPMYFYKLPFPGIMDMLLAGAFILLYSSNLKSMS